MRIEPFQASYPNFDFIASPDLFCAEAKNSFREFQANGLMEISPEPAFYVYRIETESRKHTGMIALNDVADYFAGKIKKHEKTLSERERKQMQLFQRWNAILKPVLLTYPPVPEISRWLSHYADANKPLYSARFAKDRQTHRVWAISDPAEISHLQRLFSDHILCTYIADGHHRTTTAALLHERLKYQNQAADFNHLFCAFFPADQLDILDYNRVVESAGLMNPTQFLDKMSHVFNLELLHHARKPLEKHEIVMGFRHKWYSLRWKPELMAKQPRRHVILDTSLLNELVLRDIIGVKDVRTDTRIQYIEGVKGIEGVRKALSESEESIGFLLHPVSFDDLMHVADAGDSLPPKSTYFEPRIKSGMLVKLLKHVEPDSPNAV